MTTLARTSINPALHPEGGAIHDGSGDTKGSVWAVETAAEQFVYCDWLRPKKFYREYVCL